MMRISGSGSLFVTDVAGGKLFSGKDGSSSVVGACVVTDSGDLKCYYISGYAWRIFMKRGEDIFLSSKITQGILKVLGDSIISYYPSGYDWNNPTEYEGQMYVSASGYNETNSLGLLRLDVIGNKFEKVYPHGLDFRLIPMVEGDHWVSESYKHVYPLVSTGFQLDGYQSGPVIIGYTVNKHGIVQLTNETVKKAFVSRHEMPDELAHLEGDADDYFIFSKGSVIYNKAA
jgi:hypothetical protein